MLNAFAEPPRPRGCGERQPGGVYAECGISRYGSPLERFLLDPPLPLPDGVDLVRKPQLWIRTEPVSGLVVQDPETGAPISDLLIWVGAEYYAEAPDYIEETRDRGASRRLNPNMDFTRLTRHSRMLLAHPHAIIRSWRDLASPQRCHKRLPAHDRVFWQQRWREKDGAPEQFPQFEAQVSHERVGPCLFKLWEVLPREEAEAVFERDGGLPLCLRRIGSTVYEYTPTGESVTDWQPGFIMAIPITSIALIRDGDGSVNERAKKGLEAGLERNKNAAISFYETDH